MELADTRHEKSVEHTVSAAHVEDARPRRINALLTEHVDQNVGLHLEEERRVLAGKGNRRLDIALVRFSVGVKIGGDHTSTVPLWTLRSAGLGGMARRRRQNLEVVHGEDRCTVTPLARVKRVDEPHDAEPNDGQ